MKFPVFFVAVLIPAFACSLAAQVHIREKVRINPSPLSAVKMQTSAPSSTHSLRVEVRWDQPWFASFQTYTPCKLKIDTGTSHISFTIDPDPGGLYEHFVFLPNRPAGQTAHAVFELYYDGLLLRRDSTLYGQFSTGWPDSPFNTPHFDSFRFNLPDDPLFYESSVTSEVTGVNRCDGSTSWSPGSDPVTLTIVGGGEYVQFWRVEDEFFGPRTPQGNTITALASQIPQYHLVADGVFPDSQGVMVTVRAESNGIEQSDSVLVVPYYLRLIVDPDSIATGEQSRIAIKTVDATGGEHDRIVAPLVSVGIKDSSRYGTLSYERTNGSIISQGDTLTEIEVFFLEDEHSGIQLKFLANEQSPTTTFPVTLFAKKTGEGSTEDFIPAVLYPFLARDTVRGEGKVSLISRDTVILSIESKDTVLKPLGDGDNKKEDPACTVPQGEPDTCRRIIDFTRVARTTITARARNQRGGPARDFPFILSTTAVPNSGGHDHSDNRPSGRFVTSAKETLVAVQGLTDSAGKVEYTYLSSGIGGVDSLSVRSVTPGDTAGLRIVMKIPNLKELLAGDHYDLIGALGEPGVISRHRKNHYGTSNMVKSLTTLADTIYQIKKCYLRINDISLEFGGPFDISNNWVTPHQKHRGGISADIDDKVRAAAGSTRTIARKELAEWFEKAGLQGTIRNEGNHFHVTIK